MDIAWGRPRALATTVATVMLALLTGFCGSSKVMTDRALVAKNEETVKSDQAALVVKAKAEQAAPVVKADERKALEVQPPTKVVEVSASDIIKAYLANEGQADQIYKGRTVQVSGIAGMVETMGGLTPLPYPILFLFSTQSDDDPGPSVRCHFSPEWDARLARLKTVVRTDTKRYEGDAIVVRGLFKGYYNENKGNLFLEGCELRPPGNRP
jgi:hypothetical protein